MSQNIVTHPQSGSPPPTDPQPDPQSPQSEPDEANAPLPSGRPARWAAWIWSGLPTLAVIAGLCALGYWGHATDWKMPKFSELAGAATAAPDDWCGEHGVPESQCVECNPKNYPKPTDYGWCKIHGIHQCPLHHPDVAQIKQQPQVTGADLERADRALKSKPRTENNLACPNYRRRIQFASHASVLKAGIDVEPVERGGIAETISAAGEIRYDGTRVARLSSKLAGTVWRVEKQVGERVARGEIVALVDAAEVGRVKAQLLAALAEERLQEQIHDRLEGLAEKGIVPVRQFQEAATELSQARTQVHSAQQALINFGLPLSIDNLRGLSERDAATHVQFLGLPTAVAERFDPAVTTSNLLPIVSPLEGIVTARNVVAGEVVDPVDVLIEVVDTSRMWLMLNVALEEAGNVEIGQTVRFLADGAGDEVAGRIAWTSTAADPRTRTVAVRAEVANTDGRLRNETFGSGRIVLREEEEAVLVPNAALVWDGSCHMVFVRDKIYFDDGAPKVFHTRSVRPGAKAETMTEIIAGVLPGEVVATKGSDVLRGELLKNNLGAG